ncbi:MAG TPA: YfhO family protein [Acidimicrobiales bacterium]|nr:YfhO family protein [Acidimicrobiales bacterium]
MRAAGSRPALPRPRRDPPPAPPPGGEGDGPPPPRSGWRASLPDVLGVVWVVAAAAAVLAPALRPGISLGPFDILTRFGLTRQAGTPVHNTELADQIQQFVPWLDVAWHQVHSGHLPLWNPYNVLGTPLAFNWQSSVFSPPTLVAYLFPVAYAFTVTVLVKLAVAGTGAYVLCRVLGLRPVAAAFAGTAFELSGPMIVHAGWPHTSVTCWAGWILAAVVGLLRRRHPVANTCLLALTVASAIYGGHPESLIVTAVALAVFLVAYGVTRAFTGGGLALWPLGTIALGGALGVGLGAPLLFPGLQLGLNSTRQSGAGAPAYGITHAANLVAAGLQGKDFKTAAYVGVTVLVLAAVGTRAGWRRPEVPALAAVVVVTGLLTFVAAAGNALHVLPEGDTIAWSRSVMLLALGLAVLAGYGLDALVRAGSDPKPAIWAAGAFAIAGVLVLALAVTGWLDLSGAVAKHQSSLLWPGAEVVVGLAVTGLWSRRGRPRHASRGAPLLAGGVVLLAVQTAFGLSAGIPFWAVSSSYFPTNPAIATLQRDVGSALVGFGSCRSLRYFTYSPDEVGIRPNANDGYGISEFAVYDPILPKALFEEWHAVSRQRTPPSLVQLGMFCAGVNSSIQARLFGISYVLEPPHHPRIYGSTVVAQLGTETLVSIPRVYEITWHPVTPPGTRLPTLAVTYPMNLSRPGPATWEARTGGTTASIIRLRLTDVPGWNATVDGRPVPLRSWAGGSMLEVIVPPGHHLLELHYWPRAFSVGLVVGAVTAGGLGLGAAGAAVLGRRRRRRGTAPEGAPARAGAEGTDPDGPGPGTEVDRPAPVGAEP